MKFRKLSRGAVPEKTITCRGSQPRDVHKPQLSPLHVPGSLWMGVAALPFLPETPLRQLQQSHHATC